MDVDTQKEPLGELLGNNASSPFYEVVQSYYGASHIRAKAVIKNLPSDAWKYLRIISQEALDAFSYS